VAKRIAVQAYLLVSMQLKLLSAEDNEPADRSGPYRDHKKSKDVAASSGSGFSRINRLPRNLLKPDG
jgi:hypothetical protein